MKNAKLVTALTLALATAVLFASYEPRTAASSHYVDYTTVFPNLNPVLATEINRLLDTYDCEEIADFTNTFATTQHDFAADLLQDKIDEISYIIAQLAIAQSTSNYPALSYWEHELYQTFLELQIARSQYEIYYYETLPYFMALLICDPCNIDIFNSFTWDFLDQIQDFEQQFRDIASSLGPDSYFTWTLPYGTYITHFERFVGYYESMAMNVFGTWEYINDALNEIVALTCVEDLPSNHNINRVVNFDAIPKPMPSK